MDAGHVFFLLFGIIIGLCACSTFSLLFGG